MRSEISITARRTVVVTMMNPAGGRVTRKISMTPRVSRSFRVGRNVLSSEKELLGWRRGSRIGGDPSHEAPGRAAAPGCEGGIDRTPTSDPSPSTAPPGTTALLPIKVRRPRRVGAMVIQPPSTRAAPSDASSAIVLSSPIFSMSGIIEVAVESSTHGPSLAPSARNQGAR